MSSTNTADLTGTLADVADGRVLLSVYEAAERAQRHPATVWRWIEAGYLKRYRRRLDRKTYVDAEELERLLTEPPVEEA